MYAHTYVIPQSTGCVKVWDQRQKKVPVATMEPAEGEIKRDCWTVAFGELGLLDTAVKLHTTTHSVAGMKGARSYGCAW